jgi:hypothetical protein
MLLPRLIGLAGLIAQAIATPDIFNGAAHILLL